MEDRPFPTTSEVRAMHPGELAMVLSTVDSRAVGAMGPEQAEAVVVATQRVASWLHGVQAVAVDRFAEHVLDAQERHAAELVAARDAQRGAVEAAGGTWRGDTGAVALPEPEQVAASMLAPELRISPRTMRTRLGRARALRELPRTLELALAGDLEPWRVDIVVVAARDVAFERLTEFEARLYAVDCRELPKPRLVERARRAAAKADPEGVARGIRRAPTRRSLRVVPSETAGLMRWSLEVPDAMSRRMFAAVDALAQEYLAADHAASAGSRSGGEPGGTGAQAGCRERRTVEAARLDALGDLVMANAQVETVVELNVPVNAATAAVVTRQSGRAAAERLLTGVGGLAHKEEAAADTAVVPSPRTRRTSPGTAAPAGLDEVGVDLVLGSVTRDTLAAGAVERHVGLVLGLWLEVDANPFLTHQPPRPRGPSTAPRDPLVPAQAPPAGSHAPRAQSHRGPGSEPARGGPPGPEPGIRWSSGASGADDRVWFVDGLIDAPGASALLPEHVVALLGHPDTRIRVDDGPAGSADGGPRRRRTYRPGKALGRRVRARDRHCRFPGCSVPAARCHLDHVTAFPFGETVEANLQSLCPAHHGFKHHAGWTVAMTPDGTCTWTTPSGRTHTTAPGSIRDVAA